MITVPKIIAEESVNTKNAETPRAVRSGVLKIAGHEIACAVLDNGTRVLSQRGFLSAIGRDAKPGGKRSNDSVVELPHFLASDALKPFIGNDLLESSSPVVYRTMPDGEGQGRGSKRALGFNARLLPMVCRVYVQAHAAGATTAHQDHVVRACTSLLCGFAEVGIVALVDEASGYQELREQFALQRVLDKYLQAEEALWAKTVPDEFYEQIYRLRGWESREPDPDKGPRYPQCVAQWTRDITYSRLESGVLEHLDILNPTQPDGGRKVKHHQHLTPEVGKVALMRHIHGVLALMRATRAGDWEGFMRSLDRAYPRCDRPVQLDFDDAGAFTPSPGR
jgi:hypothetical protein